MLTKPADEQGWGRVAAMRGDQMRRFWDRRAAENPLYFVDNRLDYRHPDAEEFWAAGRRDLERLLELAKVSLTPGDRVVEIGCGVGRLTREIAARAASVRALDVSRRMLDHARRYNAHLDNVTWLLGDGTSLRPVGDASADACLSHVVFQHIPNPAVTLNYVREMGRVLVPGGWAAFQVSNLPGVHHPRGPSARARQFLRATFRRGPRGQLHPAWRGAATDLDELAAAADQGGMDVSGVVGAGTQFCIVTLRRR
jgi:SAM-dependent methyltransferase